MNILSLMIAPYQTACACGRTISRPWPPNDAEAICDECALASRVRLPQAELELDHTPTIQQAFVADDQPPW
jgi:hypothetical protein